MNTIRRAGWGSRASVFLLIVVMASLAVIWRVHPVHAGDPTHRGMISAMPAGGGAGDWTIGGRVFSATASTEFDQEEGALAIGGCAKVQYMATSAGDVADEIDSEPAGDCSEGDDNSGNSGGSDDNGGNNGGSDDNGGSNNGSLGSNGDDIERYGRIEAMPASGMLGQWTISGQTYMADSDTEFEQENGGFAVGVCVQVKVESETPTVAEKVETEPANMCNGNNDVGDDNDIEFYGLIEVMPASGRLGQWTIGGKTYTADSDTEFEQEHGGFALGVCVQVKVESATPTIAEKIETEQAYKCAGNNGSGQPGTEAEFYGVVQEFPAQLIGVWRVGGITVTTDVNTEFKQENGVFEVGALVKIHFTESSGAKRAREIETIFDTEDDGSDDNGNGSIDGADGHAFGQVVSFPANLIGAWNISGVVYTATQSTEFDQEGQFVVGAQVKVEFYLNASGQRIAKEIELTNDRGEVDDQQHFKLVGYVQEKPATGFIGAWRIGGANLTANAATKFEEEHGLLAIGAYVEVEYANVGNEQVIIKLETETPPGAGNNNSVGVIENMGDDSLSAAALRASGSVWRIGGAEYVISAATSLNDANSPLALGTTAWVNSYTVVDGRQVATLIQGVTLNKVVYLPITQR